MALELLDEVVAAGCRLKPACEVLGVSARTIQRWRRDGLTDGRKGSRATPANRLTETERAAVLEVVNSKVYRDLSPKQVVPVLADQGQYIASESTIYRILREEEQNSHRENTQPRQPRERQEHEATGPNQVWTWDITYLPTEVRGLFLYLYMIVDIYSRKIVAWQVHDVESADHAGGLIKEGCFAEGVERNQLVLHSDNGSPMKGATMLATLQALGIMPSFSRPSVSNDNAFSESLFRTLKYRPAYPEQPFKDLSEARAWVEKFALWYNHEHRHSGIRYVTPAERHDGRDVEILARRDRVYQAARQRNPERWSGSTRDWSPISLVKLNKAKPQNKAA